jgi:cold shock CspA family protein
MKTGTIKTWIQEKQFGFIRPDEGGEGFWFNATSLCNPGELAHVAAGAEVEYVPGKTARGPAAFHVRLLPDSESPKAA